MKIAVASQSVHKINAVKMACQCLDVRANVIGVAARSMIDEQPYGMEAIQRGATYRATDALGKVPDCDIAIGIENGLVYSGASDGQDGIAHFDIPVVVIVPRGRMRRWYAVGAGHTVPDVYVGRAMAKGFIRQTAGAELAEAAKCSEADGTSYFTNNAFRRTDAIFPGVVITLAQFMVDTQ